MSNSLRARAQRFPGTSAHVLPAAVDVSRLLDERRMNLDRCLDDLRKQSDAIAALSARMVSVLREGQKILVAGNGGSAAEAQHFVAELVGRFRQERAPYAAVALTTDTSILTAIANDYGYDEVFARQVGALGNAGDMLLVISTSGRSGNLIRAVEVARDRDLYAVALTGSKRSPLSDAADLSLRVPISETTGVQEVQGMLLHLLCDLIEPELAAGR